MVANHFRASNSRCSMEVAMKYHGAREGYDPQDLDKRRQLTSTAEPSSWPFQFRPVEIEAERQRTDSERAFKKRSLHKRRKHGRPA